MFTFLKFLTDPKFNFFIQLGTDVVKAYEAVMADGKVSLGDFSTIARLVLNRLPGKYGKVDPALLLLFVENIVSAVECGSKIFKQVK